MAKRTIAKERRAIDRTEAALRADRKGDYRWATSNIDAIYAALNRNIGKSSKRLSAKSRRIVSKMEQLAARQKQSGRVIGRQEQAAYGGMLAGEANDQFAVARSTAAAGTREAQGQVQAGRRMQSTAGALVDLAQAGAQEAAAGADYAATQALSERTSQDVALIAQQRHDLAMAELQAQLADQAAQREFEMYKKRLRWEQNFMEKKAGQEGIEINSLSQELSNGSSIIREALAQDDSMTPSEVVDSVADQLGFDPTNDAERAAYVTLATHLKSSGTYGDNGTRDDEIAAVMYTVRDHWSRFYGQHRKDLRKLIGLNLRAIYARPATPTEEEAAGERPVLRNTQEWTDYWAQQLHPTS